MASLTNRSFAQTFGFARPIVANYRNSAGAIIVAAVDEARFDHSAIGIRRGLLVESGPQAGQHDAVSVLSGSWEVSGATTVMFEWVHRQALDGSDIVQRRAVYSTNVRATINGCLNITGHMRAIGAVSGFLPNLGPPFEGYVKYHNKTWPLGFALAASDTAVLADSDGRILLESA